MAQLGLRRNFWYFDWTLFCAALLVPVLGLIVLYSAGYDKNFSLSSIQWLLGWVKSQAFFKQSIFLFGGIGVMLLSSFIPVKFLYKISYGMYGVGVVLLIAVAQFGTVVNGSRRWLDLGPINLQPAEFMKLGLILSMARFLSRHPPKRGGYTFLQIIPPGILFLVPMALIIKQPDLGTALALGAAGTMMILFVGVRVRVLLLILLTGAALAIPAWGKLHSYQQNRILALFDPNLDPKGSSYHINQSKIAVGSGELFGKGYLNGTQTQLEFLPEHTTDFIFSVLAEEWGFVGCVALFCAYLFLLYRLLRVILKCKGLFSALVVFGITSLLFFHVFVNVGMVIGVLPVVGIPLPLFSYGGSSLLSHLWSIGIVLGISRKKLSFG